MEDWMAINIIPLVMLIGYVILIIGVANIVLKKKLGSDHFLVAKYALPLSLVVAVVLGDTAGGPSTVGVCQSGYNVGIVGILYPIALGLGMIVFASTMSMRYRKLKAVTVPEVMGILFDKKTRLITAVVIAVAYFFIGIAQILSGGALISSLLKMGIWLVELITALIFVMLIIAGGLQSIALVNVIQVIFILAGTFVSLFFSLLMISDSVPAGISRIWNELPPSFWSFSTGNPLTLTGEALGTIFAVFAAQAAITGIFAAKDEKVAVKGMWIASIGYIPIGIAFTILGLVARVYFGDTLPYGLQAAPAMILALNPVLAGIGLCGVAAAIASTGPLIFLAPVQIFVRDIYLVYINPKSSDKLTLLVNRLLTVTLIALGWLLAATFQQIIAIQYYSFAFRAGIGVLAISITYLGARYVSEDGGFWGLIVGVIVFVAWTLAGSPYGIHVAIPSLSAVFIAALVITRFRKRKHALPEEVEEALHPLKK